MKQLLLLTLLWPATRTSALSRAPSPTWSSSFTGVAAGRQKGFRSRNGHFSAARAGELFMANDGGDFAHRFLLRESDGALSGVQRVDLGTETRGVCLLPKAVAYLSKDREELRLVSTSLFGASERVAEVDVDDDSFMLRELADADSDVDFVHMLFCVSTVMYAPASNGRLYSFDTSALTDSDFPSEALLHRFGRVDSSLVGDSDSTNLWTQSDEKDALTALVYQPSPTGRTHVFLAGTKQLVHRLTFASDSGLPVAGSARSCRLPSSGNCAGALSGADALVGGFAADNYVAFVAEGTAFVLFVDISSVIDADVETCRCAVGQSQHQTKLAAATFDPDGQGFLMISHQKNEPPSWTGWRPPTLCDGCSVEMKKDVAGWGTAEAVVSFPDTVDKSQQKFESAVLEPSSRFIYFSMHDKDQPVLGVRLDAKSCPLDLVFVVDASGNGAVHDRKRQEDFALGVLSKLDLEHTDRVAVVHFAETAQLTAGWGSNRASLQEALLASFFTHSSALSGVGSRLASRPDLGLRVATALLAGTRAAAPTSTRTQAIVFSADAKNCASKSVSCTGWHGTAATCCEYKTECCSSWNADCGSDADMLSAADTAKSDGVIVSTLESALLTAGRCSTQLAGVSSSPLFTFDRASEANDLLNQIMETCREPTPPPPPPSPPKECVAFGCDDDVRRCPRGSFSILGTVAHENGFESRVGLCDTCVKRCWKERSDCVGVAWTPQDDEAYGTCVYYSAIHALQRVSTTPTAASPFLVVNAHSEYPVVDPLEPPTPSPAPPPEMRNIHTCVCHDNWGGAACDQEVASKDAAALNEPTMCLECVAGTRGECEDSFGICSTLADNGGVCPSGSTMCVYTGGTPPADEDVDGGEMCKDERDDCALLASSPGCGNMLPDAGLAHFVFDLCQLTCGRCVPSNPPPAADETSATDRGCKSRCSGHGSCSHLNVASGVRTDLTRLLNGTAATSVDVFGDAHRAGTPTVSWRGALDDGGVITLTWGGNHNHSGTDLAHRMGLGTSLETSGMLDRDVGLDISGLLNTSSCATLACNYSFRIDGRDGATLWIDDILVANAGGLSDPPPGFGAVGSIVLDPGFHRFRLQGYFHLGDDGGFVTAETRISAGPPPPPPTTRRLGAPEITLHFGDTSTSTSTSTTGWVVLTSDDFVFATQCAEGYAEDCVTPLCFVNFETPGCLNQGTCVSPDSCACVGNFAGDQCLQCAPGFILEGSCLSLLVVVIPVCTGVVIVSLAVAATTHLRRQRKRKEDMSSGLTDADTQPLPGAECPKSFELADGTRATVPARTQLISPHLLTFDTRNKFDAGGSGQVYAAQFSGFPVCVKELFSSMFVGDLNEFLREAATLSRLNHPHVLRFYGVCLANSLSDIACAQEDGENKPEQSNNTGHEAAGRHLLLVTELCHCSLAALLGDASLSPLVTWPIKHAMAAQVAEGMLYMHEKGVLHRDLKPQNVLVANSEWSVPGRLLLKICDLGLAKFQRHTSRPRLQHFESDSANCSGADSSLSMTSFYSAGSRGSKNRSRNWWRSKNTAKKQSSPQASIDEALSLSVSAPPPLSPLAVALPPPHASVPNPMVDSDNSNNSASTSSTAYKSDGSSGGHSSATSCDSGYLAFKSTTSTSTSTSTSTQASASSGSTRRRRLTVAGTAGYMPPELCCDGGGRRLFSEDEMKKIDVFAFSLLLWCILEHSDDPFPRLSREQLSPAIVRGERPVVDSSWPEYLVDIMVRCWDALPEKRPSFAEICKLLREHSREAAVEEEDATRRVDGWEKIVQHDGEFYWWNSTTNETSWDEP